MKKIILFLFISISLLAQNKPYVLLVSFDGFRWDYINRGITPNFDKFKKDGVSALSLQPTFPSKTFPNHQSIITGMFPQNHGIIANGFEDIFKNEVYRMNDSNSVNNAKWYWGEAFWETAERQGIKTASYFWPGSEVKLYYRKPTYVEKYDGKKSHDERINGVINWLKLPIDKRPHFITLYFSDADDKGHKYGPNSKEINDAIKLLDDVAGRIFSRLDDINMKDSVNVIFVSDHGMTEISKDRIINVGKILEGYNCKFFDESVLMTIEPPKEKLKEVYELLKKSENHFKVYYRHEVPEYFHFNSNYLIPSLVLIPEIGWNLLTEKGIKIMDNTYIGGNHGYSNHHLDMHGFFVAIGPNFKKGFATGTLQNIDIYPLLCKIFNIFPRSNIDGKLERIEFILK